MTIDPIPELMPGLTQAQRVAADRLELTPGVDLLLEHGLDGWRATLVTSEGHRTASGADIGDFLLEAAERWANPIV